MGKKTNSAKAQQLSKDVGILESSSESSSSASSSSSSSSEEVQDLSSIVESSSSSSNSEEESHKSAGDSGSAEEEESSSSSVDVDDDLMGGGSGAEEEDSESVEVIVKPTKQQQPAAKAKKVSKTKEKAPKKTTGDKKKSEGKKKVEKKKKNDAGGDNKQKKQAVTKDIAAIAAIDEEDEDEAATSSTEGTTSGKRTSKAPSIPKTPVAAAMHAISHMNFWRKTHETINSKRERHAMFNRLVNFDQDGHLAESIQITPFCACPKSCSLDLEILSLPAAKQIKCTNWCGKCESRLAGAAAGIPQYSFPIKPVVQLGKDMEKMQHPSNALLNVYSSRPIPVTCPDKRFNALIVKMTDPANIPTVTTAEGVKMTPIGTPADISLVYTFNRDANKVYQLVPDFLLGVLLELPERTYPKSAKSKKSDLFSLDEVNNLLDFNKSIDSVETPICNEEWSNVYKAKFGKFASVMTIIADAKANKARIHKIPSLQFETPERTSVVIKTSVEVSNTIVSLKGRRYGLVEPKNAKGGINWFIRNPNAFWNALDTYVAACGAFQESETNEGETATVVAAEESTRSKTTTTTTTTTPQVAEKKQKKKSSKTKKGDKHEKEPKEKKSTSSKKKKGDKAPKKVSQRPKEAIKPPAKPAPTKKQKTKKPSPAVADEVMEEQPAVAPAAIVVLEEEPAQVVAQPTRKRGRSTVEKPVVAESVVTATTAPEPFVTDHNAIYAPSVVNVDPDERPAKRAKLPTSAVNNTDTTPTNNNNNNTTIDAIMTLLQKLTSETSKQAQSLEALDQLVSSSTEKQLNFADAAVNNLSSAIQLIQQRISDDVQQELQKTLEAQEKRHQSELQSVVSHFTSVCNKFDQVAGFMIANNSSVAADKTSTAERSSPSPTRTVTWARTRKDPAAAAAAASTAPVQPTKAVDEAVANAAGNVSALIPLINGKVTAAASYSKHSTEAPNLDSPLASEDCDDEDDGDGDDDDSVDPLDTYADADEDAVIETASIKTSSQPKKSPAALVAPAVPTSSKVAASVVGYDDSVEPTPSTVFKDTLVKPNVAAAAATATMRGGHATGGRGGARSFDLSRGGAVTASARSSVVTSNRRAQIDQMKERRLQLQTPEVKGVLNRLMPATH